MATDCQEDNLRIPLRVGSLMRPQTSTINMSSWNNWSIVQTINLVITLKGKVPKKIHARLASSNSADSDPRTERPLVPLKANCQANMKDGWTRGTELGEKYPFPLVFS